MEFHGRWVATVLGLVWPLAAAAQETRSAPPVTTVRIRSEHFVNGAVKSNAESLNRARSEVRVEVKPALWLTSFADLAAGKADLIVVYGSDDPCQYTFEAERGKLVRASEVFGPGQLKADLLGRWATAIVAHPRSPLDEIAEEDFRRLVQNAVGQQIADPLAPLKLRYVQDGMFRNQMLDKILGPGSIHRRARGIVYRSSIRAPDLLAMVAEQAGVLSFQGASDDVWGSGLKVVPVRLRDGRRVLPTAGHVLAGEYPYFFSLLLVGRADSSAAAKEVARELLGPPLRRSLMKQGWITPETAEPGKPRPTIWPPSAIGAIPAAKGIPGSVAILPVEQLSAYFRMAGAAVQARYEDDLAAGIERTKLLALVDRSQLRRVLAERSVQLLSAPSEKPRPIIAADVLVLGQVVSRRSVAYLRVEAFHAGTATCLGLLELPIDPARPAKFARPLDELAAAWWPGVVDNLRRAQTKPVWTLTEEASTGSGEVLGKSRRALEETLARSPDIFFARYSYVPAAQREVLLRLMGLSRPEGHRLAVASDYIVTLGQSGGVPEVTIRQAGKPGEVARYAPAGGDCAAWLGEQLGRLAGSTAPAAAAPNEAQALEEYQKGTALKSKWVQLAKEAYSRCRAANRDTYLPEDQARIDEIEKQMVRHFERSLQLNPASEAAAREKLRALAAKSHGRYAPAREYAEACLDYLERYPRSEHACSVMYSAIVQLALVCSCLDSPHRRSSAGVPPDTDYEKLSRHYRRRKLGVMAAYMGVSLAEPDRCRHATYHPQGVLRIYKYTLDRYAKAAGPQEVEEALSEYGRWCDGYPGQLLHSDFLRLRCAAVRGDRSAYLELLGRMQRRWPDPSAAPWKSGAEMVVQQMSELFRMDPRRNSFYQWVKGRRGPGDLPYAGYEPAPRPKTAPAKAE